MEEKDVKQFLLLLVMLEEAFKEEVSKERAKIYFEALREFSLPQIKESFITVIRELKFFPKVAELRQFILGPPRDRERDYLNYLERSTQEHVALEWHPNREEAKKCLKEIQAKLKDPSPAPKVKATLEGDQAKEFEQKRRIAKEKAKRLSH